MSNCLQTKAILISVVSLSWWIYLHSSRGSFYFPETSFPTTLIEGSYWSSVCILMVKIRHFNSKFDQHLSLYSGSVKPKFKTGLGYWFLWESCEFQFPKFTDNFGTVSSNIHCNLIAHAALSGARLFEPMLLRSLLGKCQLQMVLLIKKYFMT